MMLTFHRIAAAADVNFVINYDSPMGEDAELIYLQRISHIQRNKSIDSFAFTFYIPKNFGALQPFINMLKVFNQVSVKRLRNKFQFTHKPISM
jgi:hypothetical protein